MSEAEEEQTSCATTDPDTETNSLSMGCLDSMERGTVEWNSGTVE